jgi:hypothetical protein
MYPLPSKFKALVQPRALDNILSNAHPHNLGVGDPQATPVHTKSNGARDHTKLACTRSFL